MASVQIELEQGIWTQITTDDKEGDIRHIQGSTTIAYLESALQPVGFNPSTATMDETRRGENLEYGGLDDGVFVWAYAITGDATISITPSVGGTSSISRFLKSMVTKLGLSSSRFKVDSQPSSFEANEQFKIFYRIQNVAQGNQIVLRFATVNALNIMVRKINLWSGGREYLVYGDDGSHTVTGTFLSVPVYNVNGNVSGGGAHPVNQVTASVAIGSGIFTAGNPPTNGDGVLTDSQGNKGNNQPLADTNQSGTPSNVTFYLVFNHIGASASSTGQFYLQWEELFS